MGSWAGVGWAGVGSWDWLGGFDRRSFVRGENVGEKASRNQKTDTSREIRDSALTLSFLTGRSRAQRHNNSRAQPLLRLNFIATFEIGETVDGAAGSDRRHLRC